MPTHICAEPEELSYVLANLNKLVVKAVNESGGYGMLVGPHATPAERVEFAQRIQQYPRNHIAQPTLGLSRVPVIADGRVVGRHVDLRPDVLYGSDIYVLPGGLNSGPHSNRAPWWSTRRRAEGARTRGYYRGQRRAPEQRIERRNRQSD